MTAKILTFTVIAGLLALTCGIIYDLATQPTPAIVAYQHLEAKNVTLKHHGHAQQIHTYRKTLKQLLDDLGINLIRGDTLYQQQGDNHIALTLDKPLRDKMTIIIDNVITTIQVETIEVPYQTRRINDSSLPIGKTKTTPGRPGILQRSYQVVLRNGQVVEKRLLEEQIIRQPQDKVVYLGQKSVSVGIDLSNAQPLVVEATAYTHTGNPTATGIYPHRGVVAVDPNVIPLYTKVYIPGYGVAQALDTGGAIKGNRIDVFFEDRQQALDFGRKTLTIYLLR